MEDISVHVLRPCLMYVSVFHLACIAMDGYMHEEFRQAIHVAEVPPCRYHSLSAILLGEKWRIKYSSLDVRYLSIVVNP